MESVGIVGIVCEEQSKNLKIEPLCLALLSVFRQIISLDIYNPLAVQYQAQNSPPKLAIYFF